MKELSLIVAMTSERQVIGVNNTLPWKLSEDLKYFKATTMGAPIIMGRKTFDSIGRVLPGRKNIVITRDAEWIKTQSPNALLSACASLEEALNSLEPTDTAPFVIGGSQIFDLALPMATKLFITWIDNDIEGDAFFPKVEWEHYKKTAETPGQDPKIPARYCVYERTV